MIRMNILKWVAASAIAIAAVPAIGFGHHASHVSATPLLSSQSTSVSDGMGKSKATNLVTTKKSKSKHRGHHKHKTTHTRSHKSATRHHTTKKHKHAA